MIANKFNEQKFNFVKYAMAVSVAGHHNIVVNGKSTDTFILNYIQDILPKLTQEEENALNNSLRNLKTKDHERPFRTPHYTIGIEGMYGGGVNLTPGEVSLAHKGVLFLENASEYKTSVLQMLRVPLETRKIMLSRAGRSVVFPADFLLAMTMQPCPCGNFGSNGGICLCSRRAREMYLKKISAPLFAKIAIKIDMNQLVDFPSYTLEELQQKIEKAIQTQKARKQKKLNNDLSSEEVAEWWNIKTVKAQERLSIEAKNKDLSESRSRDILKLARTVADMEEHELIYEDDMNVAIKLSCGLDDLFCF